MAGKRKQVDPVVEIVGAPEQEVEPQPQGGIYDPEIHDDDNAKPGPDPEDLPEQTPEDDYAAFKSFVLQTLSDFDERIRDVEVVSGAAFAGTPEGILQEIFGEKPKEFGEGHVFREDDDDVPDYVNGVQASFNRGEGDDVPWLR